MPKRKKSEAEFADVQITISYPFKYYARWLYDSGHKDPIGQLSKDGFEFYDTSDFSRLVETDKKPKRLSKSYSKATVSYLVERGIFSMAAEEYADIKNQAFSILRSRPKREIMEMLLMTKIPDSQAKEFLADILCVSTDAVPDLLVPFYRHYFWNTDEMSVADWRYFLFDKRVIGEEVPRYPNAKNLWMVLNLPSDMGIWAIGWKDKAKVDKSSMMEYLFNTAFVNAMTASSSGDVSMFSKAAAVAISAYDAAQTSIVDAVKVIETLRGLELGQKITSPIHIDALQGEKARRPIDVLALPAKDKDNE